MTLQALTFLNLSSTDKMYMNLWQEISDDKCPCFNKLPHTRKSSITEAIVKHFSYINCGLWIQNNIKITPYALKQV